MADEKESPGSLAKKKKRTKYYFYVNSQSEEADTLKDKFWRNLEEGKIDVMQTPDLYSKVKCNKKPLGLSVGNFGNDGSPVSTSFDSSPSSSSCGSCAKSIAAPFSVSGYETGSMPSNSPLVDTPIHSPFRNLDYEVGPVEVGQPLTTPDPSAANATSVAWDATPDRGSDSVSTPNPAWESPRETTDNNNAPLSAADNKSTDSSGTYAFSLDTNDDTLDCCPSNPAAPAESSGAESYRCKHLKTKRRRNLSYSSRQRQKKSGGELSSSRDELNCDEKEGDLDVTVKVEVEVEPPKMRSRKRSKAVKSKGKKYYYLVEADSKEADTLKDKFWRDVQEGKLNFCETGDLYSKVKGSRKVVASQTQNDCDTRDGISESSPMSDGDQPLLDDRVDIKDEPVQLGRSLRQKIPNGEKRTGKGRRHLGTRLTLKSVSALPESYVELIKTEFFPADGLDKQKLLSDNDQKPIESHEATELEPAANESETWLPGSPSKDLSSDQLQDSSEPAVVPAPNQNDSKLLCTCAVTVERLRTEKITVKEEQETEESKPDITLEDTSSVAHSPTEEPVTTNIVSCEIAFTANSTSSECAEAPTFSASPTPDAELNPNSFDDIDFDPNITLDDLCPTSDTDWPDVLELTEAVGRTLTSENTVLSEEKEIAILSSSSVTVPLTHNEHPVTKSFGNATNISAAAYTEMRRSLLDPLNVFNVSWPTCFNRQWGAQIEGALEYAVSTGDHQVAIALLKVTPKWTGLERPDSNVRTLLMRAVLQGHNHLAELLIARGASVNNRDASGNTPLMMSARMGDCSVAELLLENGAQIDLTNNRGETALMMAVNSGCLDLVKLLLTKGSNFALANVDNLTAMILAQRQQRTDISHLLNSHINRLMSHFQTVIARTIHGAAELVSTLFPLHCFSLKDSTSFRIHFTHKILQSTTRSPLSLAYSCGTLLSFIYHQTEDSRMFLNVLDEDPIGAVLFIGHAMIGEHTLRCLLHGRSAVRQATLNGKDLRAFTKDGYFVTSFDSICDGVNELIIHTIRDIQSETKLLVCAYVCSPQK